MLASQCACMRNVVRRLTACGSKPLLTPRPVGVMPNYTNNKTTARVVLLFGGDGGNRTPVRKSSTDSSTYLALLFNLICTTPTDKRCTDELP